MNHDSITTNHSKSWSTTQWALSTTQPYQHWLLVRISNDYSIIINHSLNPFQALLTVDHHQALGARPCRRPVICPQRSDCRLWIERAMKQNLKWMILDDKQQESITAVVLILTAWGTTHMEMIRINKSDGSQFELAQHVMRVAWFGSYGRSP